MLFIKSSRDDPFFPARFDVTCRRKRSEDFFWASCLHVSPILQVGIWLHRYGFEFEQLPKVLINYYLKSLMTDGGDDDIFCLQHQGITGFTHRPPRWQGLRPVTSENRSEGETRGEYVG